MIVVTNYFEYKEAVNVSPKKTRTMFYDKCGLSKNCIAILEDFWSKDKMKAVTITRTSRRLQKCSLNSQSKQIS